MKLNHLSGLFFSCLFAFITLSCHSNKDNTSGSSLQEAVISDSSEIIHPEYATGFKVKYLESGVRLLDVAKPNHNQQKAKNHSKKQNSEEEMPVGYQFALVPKGVKADIPSGYTAIEVPISKTICMTSLQLSNFLALSSLDFVKGITGTKNLYNKDVLKRVKDGKIVKIGMEGNFDPELILAAQPDVIFISPFKRGGYDAIKETGVTLVPHLGYKELHPLGQAEWIKFISMFIGKEKEANELFAGIKHRYNEVKKLAENTKSRPTIFSGEMHGGNWFAVGGKNHLAQIFHDAGAEYVLKDDHTGGVPIEYEQMYATAANADYWRILNSFPGDFTYEALKSSEPRNALFKAFKEKHVIYCNMKTTPYYESSPVEPDILLKDFVAIFHPELLSDDYQPKYYHLLK